MRRLADQTSGPIRAHYLELARGWEELAKKTALSSPSQPSGR